MAYSITGIQTGRGPNGELPLRREIDEWWFSPEVNDLNQRSLFIYALNNFQKRGLDKNDDLSYLDVAGIHGLPLRRWPRIPITKDPKGPEGFYCSHGQVTFPTWHTPYMFLYEQRLSEEMHALIPSTFAEQDHAAMKKAADTWRLPFWDWAMKKPTWNPANPDDPVNKLPGSGPNVPFIVTQKQVLVRTKTETAALVDNPMFHFAVPTSRTFGDYGVENNARPWWAACRVTSRWPNLPSNLDAASWKDKVSASDKKSYSEGQNQDYLKITKQLQGSVQGRGYFANTLPEAVYRLFRSVDAQGNPVMNYDNFATGSFQFGQPTQNYPSLEGIHNNIHNFSGGSGYLGNPSTAAFDPLFWVHHCNVDRLLAIWQDLFPTQTHKWLDSGAGSDNDNGPETKLYPFSSDTKGTAFTSVTCSYKQKEFGYTYPELQKWLFTKDGHFNQQAYVDSIHEHIERQYSTTPKTALLLKANKTVAKAQMRAMTPANLQVENFPPPLLEMVPKPASGGAQAPLGAVPDDDFGNPTHASWKSNDYVANVVYERFALDGQPYSITFFLGDVPEGGDYDFADDHTAISRVYNFSSEVEGRGIDESGCGNCKSQRDQNALFTGQVILTDYLIERIVQAEAHRGLTLTSLDQDEVVEYLKANLHWRITDLYDNIIPKESMPSLKISVATAQGTHFSEAKTPSQYSEYTTLWDATEGRLGGAAPGDV